jgi:hypothetical protein
MLCADGDAWAEKKAQYPDFFQEIRNIIILFSADGACVWQDKTGVFPLYFSILNLPPEIRSKYEFLELYGMLKGTHPADTRLLYRKLVDELLEMWHEGFTCWDAFSEEHVKLRCMLLAVIMDYKGLVDAGQRMDVGALKCCMKCPLLGVRSQILGKTIYAFRNQTPPGINAPRLSTPYM